MIPAILGGIGVANSFLNLVDKVTGPSPKEMMKSFQAELLAQKRLATTKPLEGIELGQHLFNLSFADKQVLGSQLPNQAIQVETSNGSQMSGVVDSVWFQGQEMMLKVGGQTFGLKDIRKIFGAI